VDVSKAERGPSFILLATYVRHIAEQLRRRGVSVEQWLGVNQLNEARLDEPDFTLSFALFRRLVLEAIALSREPALGLFVGERLVPSTHGIVGYAAMNSGTVAQALDICERFSRLRTSLVSISREVSAREVRVRFRETRQLGDIQRPILEAVVLSITTVLSGLSVGVCRPLNVAFPFPAPSHAALARDLFGCPVRYSQGWAGFALPLSVLRMPFRMADPSAFREAAQFCERELERMTADESLAGRVRRLILERHDGVPSLTAAARSLHLSCRTLHRRLVAEGTSFRKLLEEMRHTLALEHVTNGRLSLEEISYLLGYSDLPNFRRAFKRWEGVAPSEYRLRKERVARTRRRGG
jgi:AraC-like DNA-binding protein